MEAAAGDVPVGSEGLLARPCPTGVLAPRRNGAARGVPFGPHGRHGKADLCRATLEGPASERRVPITGAERFLVTGGGSRSAPWRQIVAGVLGRPIEVAREVEATGLGAGMPASSAASRMRAERPASLTPRGAPGTAGFTGFTRASTRRPGTSSRASGRSCMRSRDDAPEEAVSAALAMPAGARTTTLAAAYARYQEIRTRLPEIRSGGTPARADRLLDTAHLYDGYVFDSFGVLNVGETAIEGAAECLAALRAAGKAFCVLTNAASYTGEVAHEKYRRLGLDVRRDEIVSSRDVALAHLDAVAPDLRWSAIAAEEDAFEDAPCPVSDLLTDGADWSAAEGVLFLSSARWGRALQDRLVDELVRRPRPVVVGNPDLVAPREGGLSIEPGFWAHDLQDRTPVTPQFFGKPYGAAFEAAAARLGGGRLAMVGDTLHTDILGGQAAGLDTVLVTDHGLFAGESVDPYVADSRISPTWIMPSI